MLQTYARTHTHTQVASSSALLFITIITRREEASERLLAFRSLTPIIIVWVSGVYRAVTSEEAQQASQYSFLYHPLSFAHSICRSLLLFLSLSALMTVLSFFYFLSLIFMAPPPLLTELFSFLLSSYTHLFTEVTTNTSHFLIICSIFISQIFLFSCSCGFKEESVPVKYLMILEAVFLWFNHSPVHFYHSGKTSWV